MAPAVTESPEGPLQGEPAQVAPAERERIFDVAPEEDLLYSISADGKRKFMHPIVHKGRFWKIRRALAYGLFVTYFALPLIPIGGAPAILLDLATRRFHIFGGTFHPTDNLLLAAFGLGIIVTVFFVGSTFGRMWCGYACPQTVYLEFLFRPIEAFLEGGPLKQKKLNAAPLSGRKAAIKVAKWSIWAVVALLMASTFVAYFVGWGPLLHGLSTEPIAWKGALFAMAFLTALILFDFGWFRDQMCTIACPYGRLQNVMADADTILVAYDEQRGDPKVKVKDRVGGVPAGDCIACRSCVNACPTGTDIRRGLQPECIGTAQCIDACEVVMIGQGKPIGLIKYTSEREQKGGVRRIWRPRNIAYLALLTLAWGTLAVLVLTRGDALVEVVRGGREPYRLLPNAQVANQQRMRFTNQLGETQSFTVEVLSPEGATLVVGDSPVVVEPSRLVTVNAVTSVPQSVFVDGQIPVRYLVTSDKGFRKEVEFLLLGPYGPAPVKP
ncbi:MAG TPA: cytochrome c oxidase accessory protein CcoG [Thermoanaerobaculia bacterium]|nr:cytochrome c oxidase accessory protein CcoG [Thermoanaerobaculia bacterium]